MRVNRVEKCRQSPGKCGKCGCEIKVGDPYRWWKFRYGGKQIRCLELKCNPRGSELTSNPFQSALLKITEDIEDAIGQARSQTDPTIAISAFRDGAEELRNLGQEQQEKLDNMPEGLQQGDTGQLLENRANECEDKACELESAADTAESDWENRSDDDEERGEQEICDSILDELDSATNDISID